MATAIFGSHRVERERSSSITSTTPSRTKSGNGGGAANLVFPSRNEINHVGGGGGPLGANSTTTAGAMLVSHHPALKVHHPQRQHQHVTTPTFPTVSGGEGFDASSSSSSISSASSFSTPPSVASNTKALLRKLGILSSVPKGGGRANGTTSNKGIQQQCCLPAELELQHKHITGQDAMQLCTALSMNSIITSLKVGCNELGDEGAAAVARALEHHVSLVTLDLGFNTIGDEGAEALGKSLCENRRLKTLYLSGNCINQRGARALGHALSRNHSLTVLHLTGNSIGPSGAAALAEGLAQNNSIEKLYLAGNSLGPAGAAALFGSLATNTSLKCLYVSDNHIGDAGIYALSKALQHNRQLIVLELGFNSVTTHAGLRHLWAALCNYHSLKALHLDNNHLDDHAVEFIAAALSSMSLESLDVGFNAINTLGVATLMQVIARNKTLKSLTLSGNTLDTESAKSVAMALASNFTLLELYLDHISIGVAGERFIAAGLEANPCPTLKVLTGFRLGYVLARMGQASLPSELEALTNEQTLEFLRMRKKQQQQQTMARSLPEQRPQQQGRSSMMEAQQQQPRMEDEEQQQQHEEEGEGGKTATLSTSLSASVLATSLSQQGFGGGNLPPSADLVLPAALTNSLIDCSKQSFDPAELFALHQHYFSPPPNPTVVEGEGSRLVSSEAGGSNKGHARPAVRVGSVDDMPNPKRHCANVTKSRIGHFPRLKGHLEVLLRSGGAREYAALIKLRQLRVLEGSKTKYQGMPDVEALLLDHFL